MDVDFASGGCKCQTFHIPMSGIRPAYASGCKDETRRCILPGITVQGHLVTAIQEFFHVNRIEAFSRIISKVRRNVGQIEVVPVTPAQCIYLVEITDTLRPDE